MICFPGLLNLSQIFIGLSMCERLKLASSMVSASASAKILDTPRLGITSRHTMVRVVHDKMLCLYMYNAG